MIFNKHSAFEGSHALLGASSYSWLNYTPEKMIEVFSNLQAKRKGTELHEFAAKAIKLGVKLPKTKKTLNLYVNDAIGYKMIPEQILFYSENCFGTADTISFRNNILRIHDLKTGVYPAKMDQLMIYTALFCLEYHIKPSEIKIELRIYQNNEIIYYAPEVDEIVPIMDKIVEFDKIIKNLKEQED